MENITHTIDVEKIDSSIQLLEKYVKETDIKPVISILEALKKDPHNESLVKKLADTLNNIGVTQGAVLTYAPYIAILVSNNLFEND